MQKNNPLTQNNDEKLDQIKHRSVSGVLAHTARTIVIQLVTLVASLLLAAFLEPREFGIFFSVSALVSLFVFLSDVGLAASLIQMKKEPTDKDLATSFTIQQMLAIGIMTIIFIGGSFWSRWLDLDQTGIWLLYALAISFPLASLKTIPSILLERDLDFNRLVLPQIIETIVFYGLAVTLAWQGWGVTSYSIAVIARAVVGAIAIYALKPWRPILGIYRESLKKLLSFGLPFQLNDLLARIKDDLLIVVMRRILSADEIGYLGWAKRWSLMPFRFTVDSVIRVTFPAYSRLQHESAMLTRAVEKSLFFIALIAFPILFGIAGMAYPLTVLVEAYAKWQPALPALYWFLADVSISAMTVPLINTLNALGHIKTTLKLMTAWTGLIWVLIFPLTRWFGFTGLAIATAIVTTCSLVTIIIVKKYVKVQFVKQIWRQVLASGIMLLLLVMLASWSVQSWTSFWLSVAFGALAYFLSVMALFGKNFKAEVEPIISILLKRA